MTERISHTNFVDLYYDVFVRDLPVFVTADSVLHAWSRSYEAMLEQLEEAYLRHSLRKMLDGLAAHLRATALSFRHPEWGHSFRMVDYYLTVARSLLSGTEVREVLYDEFENPPSVQPAVQQTLSAIALEQNHRLPWFSVERPPLDTSRLKVRGYYEKSRNLQRYFRAMMWCGLVDFRLTDTEGKPNYPEIAAALAFNAALDRSGQREAWERIDAVIETFVGPKDSMDFRQLQRVIAASGLSLFESRPADLTSVIAAILDGKYGIQEIIGDSYYSPFGPEQVWLPPSFTVLGQRFTMDAWALGQVLFDRIHWDGPETAATFGKVIRRRGSALDVAFTVFGNDVVNQDLMARMARSDGLPFRDGLPYQHNLAAARATIDQQIPEAWQRSIYTAWLGTLRTLSNESTAPHHAEAHRTRAWALRRLNTQLASWTQLRHATVLYTKQTTIPFFICSYPAGFVEPSLEFWGGMQQLALQARDLIAALPMSGQAEWQARANVPLVGLIDLAVMKTGQLSFLNRFATNMATLKKLAAKQLTQTPFSPAEETFLLNLVEVQTSYTGEKSYSGWYPRLFYAANEGFDWITAEALSREDYRLLKHASTHSTAIVVDVLTAPPDARVGDVNFMLVAVDNGPDRMVYGGPVFSHYEVNMPAGQRLTDSAWEAMLRRGDAPPAPEWTRPWLVPNSP